MFNVLLQPLRQTCACIPSFPPRTPGDVRPVAVAAGHGRRLRARSDAQLDSLDGKGAKPRLFAKKPVMQKVDSASLEHKVSVLALRGVACVEATGKRAEEERVEKLARLAVEDKRAATARALAKEERAEKRADQGMETSSAMSNSARNAVYVASAAVFAMLLPELVKMR